MAANDENNITSDVALVAIAALLAEAREDAIRSGSEIEKTEVVLSGAGLGPTVIASLLRKKTDTVRKTLQRSK